MFASWKAYLLAGSPPHYVTGLGVAAFFFLEWWLPRSRFKANSTLEAMANLAKRALLGRIPLLGKLVVLLATPEPTVAPVVQLKPVPTGEEK